MRLHHTSSPAAPETQADQARAKNDRGLSPSRFLASFLDEPAEKPRGSVFRRFFEKVVPSRSFKPGDRVLHKTLGAGKVRLVQGDTVTIDSPKGEVTLSLSYCLEQGLLSAEK